MARTERLTDAWVAGRLPPRPDDGHKGTFGRLLVIAGSLELPGAALLVGLGAMRAGVGVARLAAADSVVARLAGSIPELTWMSLDEEAPGIIAPAGWRRITSEAADVDALVVGPGIGRQPATQRRTRQLVAALRRPAVIDADGLNALAADRRWWKDIRATHVLTPHPAEFARLTGEEMPATDDEARSAAASEAAASWNQVVVLKGARTVVAAPDGATMRSDIATPALATAGTGDVLSGIIGAFLAAGSPAFEAAACAVAVHARAGELAAERVGTTGTMARDVAALVPAAVTRLRST